MDFVERGVGGLVDDAYDTLTYGHTPTSQLETMTDQAGNQWSWDYDLRGREVTAVDPDTGTTTKITPQGTTGHTESLSRQQLPLKNRG